VPGALAAAAHTTATTSDHTMWTVARVYIGTGHLREASALADRLGKMPDPFSRMVGLCVEAEIAASRHEWARELGKARAAVALHEGYLARFELGKALLASGQPAAARVPLELDRRRPWEAATSFGDLVSALRDVSLLAPALARAGVAVHAGDGLLR
jgi:hypothetical protein